VHVVAVLSQLSTRCGGVHGAPPRPSPSAEAGQGVGSGCEPSAASVERVGAHPAICPQVGQIETFEACYRRLWPQMVRLAHLVCGSEALGEEVVQDAFLGLQQRWHDVERPEAYVRSAVLNRARTAGRRSWRERPGDVPERGLDLTPETDAVWGVLRTLSERQRAAVVLRFYEDLPDDEIARLLGCRPATVRSLVHRALARLQEVLR
jgi:RNA polymerase sigma factor (sigma-70 family)